MDDAGESYGELGGQLPDASQKERGKAHVELIRQKLVRADKPCPGCLHHLDRWHLDGSCTYRIAPRGELCGCTENGETDG